MVTLKIILAVFWLFLLAVNFAESATPCVKHTFVSGKTDSADSTIVSSSEWNDCHTIDDGAIPLSKLASTVPTTSTLTTNTIPKATGADSIGDSVLLDCGSTTIGVGACSGSATGMLEIGGGRLTNKTAPSTPGTGLTEFWGDSTAKQLQVKDDAGNVNTTVRTAGAATSNQWVTHIPTTGVPATAQPAFSNLSGAATFAQTPQGAPASDDQVYVSSSSSAGAWKSIPDCTDTGGNHLNYTASTNAFSCGTSGGGGGTSVKQIFIPAVALIPDGTNCLYPSTRTINSGHQVESIRCADSGSSVVRYLLRMPSTWNAGTVTITATVLHGTTETITWAMDFATACRRPADTWNNTYGTAQSANVSITTANQTAEQTTAAITADGTCAAGAMLLIRGTVDATDMSTNGANTDLLGITVNATY